VHGHTTLEHTGFFGAVGRGDDALATARSLSTARRRAVRADRAEAGACSMTVA
jgi:hypothetical protein